MGRKRTKNRHLPHRMVLKHGAYYHVMVAGVTASGKPRKVWRMLSREYGVALGKWAELEGRRAAAPVTVADLIAAYLAYSQGRLSPETMAGYERSAKRLAKPFGKMRPEDLKREHVYRYLVAAGSVAANRDRALLGAAYTHALNLGLATINPAHKLNYRNPEKRRQRYVTDAELDRLVAAAPEAFGRIIRFAYLTGLREGDVCRLLLTAASDEGLTVVTGKTGKAVLIAWSDTLRALWREVAGNRIGAQPLFRARGGAAYTPNGLRAVWRKVKTAAGLLDVTFHDLRRKAGSDVTEEHASALLGHADPKTTRRHYRAKLVPVNPTR